MTESPSANASDRKADAHVRRADVDRAVAALLAGGAVILPTDTVYGVATATAVPGSTAALFRLKRRPADVALPVLCADEVQARSLAGEVPPGADRLMSACWPGPLTLVVPRREGLDLDLGGPDDETVGLRVPDAPLVRAIAGRTGPLACTSANRHGEPPAATAGEAAAALGPGVAAVVDGGRCDGLPSTVVGWVDGEHRILRQGALPASEVDDLLRST